MVWHIYSQMWCLFAARAGCDVRIIQDCLIHNVLLRFLNAELYIYRDLRFAVLSNLVLFSLIGLNSRMGTEFVFLISEYKMSICV